LGAVSGVATLGSDGKILTTQLPSYVDDVLEFANLAALPATGESSKIYITLDSGKIYRWSGSLYIEIATSVGSADVAVKLVTARTIAATGDATWSTSFDGSANVSSALTLSDSGVSAGSYGTATRTSTFTVDSKGRLTAAGTSLITPAWSNITSKPTTISGYGITDAQPLETKLTSISSLSDSSSGILRLTNGTASYDTNVYLTGNQSISFTGDATGSGTTSVALTLANSGVTSGTYNNSATAITPLTVDTKGRITSTGTNVTITPAWDSITGKPTTISGYGITDAVNSSLLGTTNGVATLGSDGKVPSTQLPSYVDDILEFANYAGLPATGETGKLYLALDTNKVYRWSGSVYIEIASSVGSADVATKLVTSRTISLTGDATWSVAFDGSANASSSLTLANSGVAASSYGSATYASTFTVDSKGRLTAAGTSLITPAWSNITSTPTTISGYGITDAQPLNSKLTSVSELSNSSTGLVKLTNGVASFDTNTYLTGNQSISFTGDATGSGTTSVSLTLSNTGVIAGSYNQVTVDTKGRVSSGVSATNTPTANQVFVASSTSAGSWQTYFTGTTNASDLSSGTLDPARLPATGVSASSLTTGTLPAARLPNIGSAGTYLSVVADDTGRVVGGSKLNNITMNIFKRNKTVATHDTAVVTAAAGAPNSITLSFYKRDKTIVSYDASL
jgi:phage-related tail fiber protein